MVPGLLDLLRIQSALYKNAADLVEINPDLSDAINDDAAEVGTTIEAFYTREQIHQCKELLK